MLEFVASGCAARADIAYDDSSHSEPEQEGVCAADGNEEKDPVHSASGQEEGLDVRACDQETWPATTLGGGRA